MKKLAAILFLFCPFFSFSQTEVPPEGDKLVWIIAILLGLPILLILISNKLLKKNKQNRKPFSISWSRLKVELSKNKAYRPNVLLLKVTNKSRRAIDLEAPVLCFRKIWSKRKFKLKGINRNKIYPLYLEAGKTHELRIDLSVFYKHDRKLKRFHRAKVRLIDTKGKKYSSSFVTLRKSLFS